MAAAQKPKAKSPKITNGVVHSSSNAPRVKRTTSKATKDKLPEAKGTTKPKPAKSTTMKASKEIASSNNLKGKPVGSVRVKSDQPKAQKVTKPLTNGKSQMQSKSPLKKSSSVAANKATTKDVGQKSVPKGVTKNPSKASATSINKKRKLGDIEPKPIKRRRPLHRALPSNSLHPLCTRSDQVLKIFNWGTGNMGELGLGPEAKAQLVKRPRVNNFLNTDNNIKIVDFAAGGMHSAALADDGKILTWGVNDLQALGRNTQWSEQQPNGDKKGAEESSSDDDDEKINPLESTPGFVTGLPEDESFASVSCSDSMTLALSEKGNVYSWGTFRAAEGALGFSPEIKVQPVPLLLESLYHIVSIATGVDHVLALDAQGKVYVWGNGQQYQLGRQILERHRLDALRPRLSGLKNIRLIGSGSYHSFAVTTNNVAYAWGLNQYGQCGVVDDLNDENTMITQPTEIEALKGIAIKKLLGGEHHSCALTHDGELYVWGRLDSSQLGIPKEVLAKSKYIARSEIGIPRCISKPTLLKGVPKFSDVSLGTHHALAISAEDGTLWSWGYSESYQTGQGIDDDVEVPTKIVNTATQNVKFYKISAGGQFSIAGGVASC